MDPTTPTPNITSFLSHLECSKQCDPSTTHLNPDELHNLCTKCGAPLLVRYDTEAAKKYWKKEALLTREKSLWRYHELLPVRDLKYKITLGEGFTPLWKADKLGVALNLDALWFKDEGVIPTGTFKARGAAVGISRAKELGVKTIAMPTNGNAGAAWAAYGARADIQLVVAMPIDAPPLAVEEIIAYDATAFMVNGQITDAGKMIAGALQAKKSEGWFDASTLKEPYRIEGKKTMGYEIAEQFGWELPDAIIYPTGGGVGLIGIYKAFEELQALGWVAAGPLPKMVAVQASGCAPIIKAWDEGKPASVLWENANTIAQGIRVPKAIGDFIVLDICKRSGGTCIAVDDDIVTDMLNKTSKLEGAFICPEGAAAVAAASLLRTSGWLKQTDKVVILNTGTGFKYPGMFKKDLQTLEIGQTLPV